MSDTTSHTDTPKQPAVAEQPAAPAAKDGEKKKVVLAREPSDLDPTRYGDWEKNGRCIDF